MRRFARRQPLGAFSVAVLCVLIVVAGLANVVAPYPPTKNDVGPALDAPSLAFPAGTDQLGRDLLSRLIHGSRIALAVGLGATLVATVIATILGAVAGYLGGMFDHIAQRFVDATLAIPGLILLITIMVVLGIGITNVIIALAISRGIASSRLIRSAVLSVSSEPYIEAAQTIGATRLRVLVRHVLPNIVPIVIILMSTAVGGNIIAEASLSFLGYGVPPPNPSWGGMLSTEGRNYMLVAPWILIGPTLALSFVVYAMNMFGDALRDELDPRLRGSQER